MAPKSFSCALAACLILPAAAWPIQPPRPAQQNPPAPSHGEATGADDVARSALQAAPRRAKLGKIRGVRLRSDVTFESAPDDPYVMTASFGFPERSRLVLSSAGGAYERYQLGDTLFARDLLTGAAASSPSLVLRGPGRTETLLDTELRRAVFFWPDGTRFTGKGTTYSAKIGDVGILLATVDEKSGLPTRVRTFGPDGRAGAEMHSIQYGKPISGRRWPTSLVFAAGGQDVWSEAVTGVETDWRFSDGWFLPLDRLTGIMGAKATGKLRAVPLAGAWVYARTLPPPAEEDAPRPLRAVANELAESWALFRQTASEAFGKDQPVFVSPYAEIVLGDQGQLATVRYEVTAPESVRPKGDGWTWRQPENAWSHPLDAAADAPEGAELIQALQEAGSVIDAAVQTQLAEGGVLADSKVGVSQRSPRVLRFQVGEESIGEGALRKTRGVALGVSLIQPAAESEGTPEKDD